MKAFAAIFLLIAISSVFGAKEKDDDGLVEVNYTVWVGDNVDIVHSISLSVPKDSTMFEVMNLAAATDPTFAFEYQTFSIGHFITSIGGHSQNGATNLYWFFYNLPFAANPVHKPPPHFLSDVGVDLAIVRDGGNYLFWLRTWVPSGH